MPSFEDNNPDAYYNMRRELGIVPGMSWKFAGHVALALHRPDAAGAIYTDLRAPQPETPARCARIEIQCQEDRVGALITPARSRRPPGLVSTRPLYDVATGCPEHLLLRAQAYMNPLAYVAVISETEGAGIIPLMLASGQLLAPVGGLTDARMMIRSAAARVKEHQMTAVPGLALPLATRYLFPAPLPPQPI